MKVYELYVAIVKSVEYNHEARGAYTSLYEANQFVKSCQYCEWGKNAEVKIEKMTF